MTRRLTRDMARVGAVLAAITLAVGAWLLWPTAPPPPRPLAAHPVAERPVSEAPPLPALVTRGEAERPTQAPPSAAPARDEPLPTTPLGRALGDPSAPRRFVIDVRALLATEPAKMMLRCLPRRDRGEIDTLRGLGFDPLEIVDTLAVVGDVPLVQGRFAGVDFARLEPERTVERVGPRTVLYRDGDEAFAVWDDQLLIGNREVGEVMAVIARMEGEAPTGPAPTPRGMAYGEIPAKEIFGMLSLDRSVSRPLAALLTEEGAGLRFSVDVDDDGLRVDAALADAGPIAAQALSAAFEAVKAGGFRPSAAEGAAQIFQALAVRADGADVAAHLPISTALFAELMGDCARAGELP